MSHTVNLFHLLAILQLLVIMILAETLSVDTRLPQIRELRSNDMYLIFANRGSRKERKTATQEQLLDSFLFALRLNPDDTMAVRFS